MTDLRKAAEMALEFVDWLCGDDHSVKPKNKALDVREALRQALAQSVDAVNMSQERVDETVKNRHEPVAWITDGGKGGLGWRKTTEKDIPLYTAPPKREWVGLTDEEAADLWADAHDIDGKMIWTPEKLFEEIERRLKEKNNA